MEKFPKTDTWHDPEHVNKTRQAAVRPHCHHLLHKRSPESRQSLIIQTKKGTLFQSISKPIARKEEEQEQADLLSLSPDPGRRCVKVWMMRSDDSCTVKVQALIDVVRNADGSSSSSLSQTARNNFRDPQARVDNFACAGIQLTSMQGGCRMSARTWIKACVVQFKNSKAWWLQTSSGQKFNYFVTFPAKEALLV